MDTSDDQSAISTVSTTASSSKYEQENEEHQLLNGTVLPNFLLPDPDFESSQRSVLLTRSSFNDSFGFALQSYVFKTELSDAFERITYVDYVSNSSSAERSGVRKGDVVIAVNDQCVISSSHAEIVSQIQKSLHVNLILVFKDVARIVSLSVRSLQLKCLLATKSRELKEVEEQEKELEADELTTLYELDEQLKSIESENFRHLIRINSSSSIGSAQVTRL